jgi:hypothetical protein
MEECFAKGATDTVSQAMRATAILAFLLAGRGVPLENGGRGCLAGAFSKAELVLGPSASSRYRGLGSGSLLPFYRKLAFLKDFWLVCGLLFEIAVCLVMN